MPDNPQAAPGGPFPLPDHRVLELEGRDAGAFAHAQFMNDVAALPVSQWQWNGWLTPKGRVIALFALLKLAPERLWLLLPDTDPQELAAKLQRYVFRSKVALRPRTDCLVSGRFAAPARAQGATLHGDDAGVELDLSAEGGMRTLEIRTGDAPALPPSAEAVARWAAFDLRHGLPRLPTSQAEEWTPQMLSLERLRAYSVKKGCYPGQEIVARTHFLGQAKRGLVLFEADAPLRAGEQVHDGERSLGTLVSAVETDAHAVALAVLPLEREPGLALRAGEVPVRERPLFDGLAR